MGDAKTPSFEHDYLYVAAGQAGLYIFDMTEPDNIVQVVLMKNLGGSVDAVDVASQMSPPGVDDYAMLANSVYGLQVVDVSKPTKPVFMGSFGDPGAGDVFVEVQQLDRFLNEQGEQLKENSHPFIQNFSRADMVRILSTPIGDCCCGTEAGHGSADLDGNGVVDLFDLMDLLRSFGTLGDEQHGNLHGDLNGDSAVNMQDIVLMLEAMEAQRAE